MEKGYLSHEEERGWEISMGGQDVEILPHVLLKSLKEKARSTAENKRQGCGE